MEDQDKNFILSSIRVEYEKIYCLHKIDNQILEVLGRINTLHSPDILGNIIMGISIFAPLISLILTLNKLLEVLNHVLGIIILYYILFFFVILNTIRTRLFIGNLSPLHRYERAIEDLNKLKWVYSLKKLSVSYLVGVVLILMQFAFVHEQLRQATIIFLVIYSFGGIYLYIATYFVEDIFTYQYNLTGKHKEGSEESRLRKILKNKWAQWGLLGFGAVLEIYALYKWLLIVINVFSLKMIGIYLTVTIAFLVMVPFLSNEATKRILQDQLEQLLELRRKARSANSIDDLTKILEEAMKIKGFSNIVISPPKLTKLQITSSIKFEEDTEYKSWLHQQRQKPKTSY